MTLGDSRHRGHQGCRGYPGYRVCRGCQVCSPQLSDQGLVTHFLSQKRSRNLDFVFTLVWAWELAILPLCIGFCNGYCRVFSEAIFPSKVIDHRWAAPCPCGFRISLVQWQRASLSKIRLQHITLFCFDRIESTPGMKNIFSFTLGVLFIMQFYNDPGTLKIHWDRPAWAKPTQVNLM